MRELYSKVPLLGGARGGFYFRAGSRERGASSTEHRAQRKSAWQGAGIKFPSLEGQGVGFTSGQGARGKELGAKSPEIRNVDWK
jgi:hypothetical protein